MKTITRLPPRGGATGPTGRWHPYHAPKLTPASTPVPAYSCPSSPTLTSHTHTYLSTPISTLVSASDSFRGCFTKPTTGSVSATALQSFQQPQKERQELKRLQKEKFENALKGTSVVTYQWRKRDQSWCCDLCRSQNRHRQPRYFYSSRQLAANLSFHEFQLTAATALSPTHLTELAVQRLADIWKETSYVIHSTSSASSVSKTVNKPRSSIPARCRTLDAHQLPTPLTPSTHTFTSPQPSLSQPPPALPSTPCRIPLRAFVHEVLRRSKTMWPALQIALCYLDAAKSKVPNAIAEVKQGEGLQAAEAALDQLFGSASADDLSGERQPTVRRGSSTPQTLISSPSSAEVNPAVPLSQVINIRDVPSAPSSPVPQAPAVALVDSDASEPAARPKRRRTPPAPVPPLPPRPSPLLCPRRMFVAALILATKFTQDRVYSNRAWAKISGLDPREIGRCERALGEALEWRLWVGKGVADEPTAFLRNFLLTEESLAKSRLNSGLARSKSDGVLLTGSKDILMTPEWSQRDMPFGDLSSALKRSTSLTSSDLSCSPRSSVPMLSDPSTLVLTPANADLDAMDLEPTPLLQHSSCTSTSSSFSFDTTPTSSFFSNEFSFTPSVGNILSTPHSSLQTSPDLHLSDAVPVSYAVPFSKLASGFKAGTSLDPMGFSRGIEGTFDIGIEDIVGNF